MAIIFGNINNGTGGGTGNLWRFQTAPPVTDIMLNDLAGVSGIASPLPGTPEMNFVFKEVAPGVFIGGFINYITPSRFVTNAVLRGGDDSAGIRAVDLINGAEAGRYANFNGAQPVVGSFVSDGIDSIIEEILEPTSYLRRCENQTSNDKTEAQQSQDAKEFTIYVAGVATYRLRYDAQGFALYNGAGANDLILQITETGEILTNQTEAATGADNTIVGRLPVYDEAGILIGYAPLMVDP